MLKYEELSKMFSKNLNNYEMVTIVAKRTRQLVNGATPLIKPDKKEGNVTIAALEFAEDKVREVKQ